MTVRELARIQGIPDDFILYGSDKAQYEDIRRAIPPIVAKRAAQTIQRVIGSSSVGRVVRLDEEERARKRARVDDDDDE